MEQHQIEELNKLKSLLDSGVLTQEEFETEKEKVLKSLTISQSADTKGGDIQSVHSNDKAKLQQGMSDKKKLGIIAAVVSSAVSLLPLLVFVKIQAIKHTIVTMRQLLQTQLKLQILLTHTSRMMTRAQIPTTLFKMEAKRILR